MATTKWTNDIGTGVLKNHALSRDLFFAATEDTKIAQFAEPIEDFGRKMGDTVNLTRIKAMTEPTDVTLNEEQRIPEDQFQLSSTSITVQEIGRAVPFTNLATELYKFDLQGQVQRTLVNVMGRSLDTLAATAAKTVQLKMHITGASAYTITAGSSFGGQSTANMNMYMVEEIADQMYDSYYIEPYVDGDYMAVFRKLGIRGIMRDDDWEEWHKYTDPSAKYNGEMGRMENIRFTATNHANALGKVGAANVLGEGIVFGQDFLVVAETQTPELRAQMNVGDDFGRQHAVAWYGTLKYGLPWDTSNAGEVKGIHIGST